MQGIKIQINSIAILIMMAIFAHAQSSESSLEVTHTQNTKTVPLYEVFEITFQHDREYENPFFDMDHLSHRRFIPLRMNEVGGTTSMNLRSRTSGRRALLHRS